MKELSSRLDYLASQSSPDFYRVLPGPVVSSGLSSVHEATTTASSAPHVMKKMRQCIRRNPGDSDTLVSSWRFESNEEGLARSHV